MVRFIPGVIAAIAAYLSLIFLAWIPSVVLRFLLFLGIYLVVAFVMDDALKGYGKRE